MTKARRGKGRPPGFSKSLEAACLFRELRRRGLSYRKALDAVDGLLGVGHSGVEKYLKHEIKPVDERSDRVMAAMTLALYWNDCVRQNLESLTREAAAAVEAILSEDWTEDTAER